jgi:hypothetical protein
MDIITSFPLESQECDPDNFPVLFRVPGFFGMRHAKRGTFSNLNSIFKHISVTKFVLKNLTDATCRSLGLGYADHSSSLLTRFSKTAVHQCSLAWWSQCGKMQFNQLNTKFCMVYSIKKRVGHPFSRPLQLGMALVNVKWNLVGTRPLGGGSTYVAPWH